MVKAKHSIEVSHLVKTYGEVKAVSDISFYVDKGSFFAFFILLFIMDSIILAVYAADTAKEKVKQNISTP